MLIRPYRGLEGIIRHVYTDLTAGALLHPHRAAQNRVKALLKVLKVNHASHVRFSGSCDSESFPTIPTRIGFLGF